MSLITIENLHMHADVCADKKLCQLIEITEQIMATLDQVLQKVTDQDTALDSVRELIVGLRQQLKDALANANLSPENQAKVDAIFAAAEKNSAEIVEALAENVPPPDVPPVV